MAAKPRSYQVAMLEHSLGDEAMCLYNGFQFATPQEHRTTTEILTAFDEFAVGEANETFERYQFNNRKKEEGESFDDFHAALRVLADLQFLSYMRKLDDKRYNHLRHKTVGDATRVA